MRDFGIALALVAVLSAPAGVAGQDPLQQGTCDVTLAAADDIPQGSFDPGEERVYTFVVENTGNLDAEGTFQIISTLPDGWFWSPTEQNLQIAGGESTEVDITVRWEGDVERDAQLQADVEYDCGGVESGSTDTVSLAFTHAPVTDQGGDDELPWAWILFGTIVAGTVVGVPIAYRRRGARVRAACEDSEREVAPGRGTSYPITIENESSDAVSIDLEVTDVQEGWSALTTLPNLELGAEESRTIYMMVRAPEEAKPGDLCVAKLGVQPEESTAREVKTLTRVDEDAGGDERPPEGTSDEEEA
jgi:uncharacterized repeat protein (TIGR01451 family)